MACPNSFFSQNFMCDNCKLEAVKSRTVVKCKLKFENYAQTRWCTSLMVRVLIEIQFFEGGGGDCELYGKV